MRADKLVDLLEKDALVNISLDALRTIFEKILKTNLVITMDNKAKDIIAQRKQDYRKAEGTKKTSFYPYAIMNVGDVSIRKDYVFNNRTMQRHGIHITQQHEGKTFTRQLFAWPVRLTCELHYLTNDPYRALALSNALVILNGVQGLSFKISLGGFSYTNLIELPESSTVPMSDVNAGESPSGLDVQISFVYTTYAGFFSEVAAVQRGSPKVAYHVDGGSLGESFDGEVEIA